MFNNDRDFGDYLKRFRYWIILILAGFGCSLLYSFLIKERDVIVLDVPSDMKWAFNMSLIKSDELSIFDNKIVIQNSDNASIVIGYGKENDESYYKIAFSPFVIAYSNDKDKLKELKKSDLLVKSEYGNNKSNNNTSEFEFDFDLKILLNEVIGEGKWKNVGISDVDEIKVYYPSEDSVYWHDFYNFMLININDGIYPQNAYELSKCENVIKKFLDKTNTIPVSDLEEELSIIGEFSKNSLYIFPEKAICEVDDYKSMVFYSKYVTMFNYYAKPIDETGKELLDNFSIKNKYYRDKNGKDISPGLDGNPSGIRNSFNGINIDTAINIEED